MPVALTLDVVLFALPVVAPTFPPPQAASRQLAAIPNRVLDMSTLVRRQRPGCPAWRRLSYQADFLAGSPSVYGEDCGSPAPNGSHEQCSQPWESVVQTEWPLMHMGEYDVQLVSSG